MKIFWIDYNKTIIEQPPHFAKDYIHIDDVNRLLYGLMTKTPLNRIYNIGYGQIISNNEIASWLRKKGAKVDFKNTSKKKSKF